MRLLTAKHLAFVLLTAWLAACLAWISPAYAVPALNFANLKNTDNVGHVSKILQDHQGFIWWATNRGLLRFDGYEIKSFHHQPNNPDSLPNEIVVGLAEDHHQQLWVATREGLALWDAEQHSFKTFLPSITANALQKGTHIQDMISDGEHGLWLATRLGLQHFDIDTGQFRIYRHDPVKPDSLALDNVQTLAMDKHGGLWVATWPSGLDYLPKEGEQFQHFQIMPQNPQSLANTIKSLFVDSQQRLWIGTEAGIFVWQSPGNADSKISNLPVTGITENIRSNDFIEDNNGTLWAASNVGLLRWDNTRHQFDLFQHHRDDPSSLADNTTLALLQDRSGALWVSNLDSVSRTDLSAGGFEEIIPKSLIGANDRTSNFVRTITPAESEKLWLATIYDLLLVNPKSRWIVKNLSHLFSQNGHDDSVIYSLYQQPQGPLWIGTRDGLFRYDESSQTLKQINFRDKAANFVNKIVPGAEGVLWLGTGGGLIEYSPQRGVLRHFKSDPQDPSSLAENSVVILLVDRAGKVWAAGGEVSGGGLSVLDPLTGRFQRYHPNPANPNSLPSDFIHSMLEDDQGTIWLATSNGFCQARVMADGHVNFLRYPISGEVDLRLLAFSPHHSERIWLVDSSGLAKFDSTTSQYVHYALPSEGYTSMLPAINTLIYWNESLYIGSSKGIIVVHPTQIRENTIAPQIAITDISILNHPLNPDIKNSGVKLEGSITQPKRLTLPWQIGVFSLRFAALHYADPVRNRYAYKLEGFDKDWIEGDSNNRVATYTNLDPGQYLLRIKASNNTGIWNEAGISLPIIITPPYWQTTWFRGCILLSVFLLLLSLS